MKTLIIIAHPDENSFNYAISEEVQSHLKNKNHELKIKDLYKESFDPVLKEDNYLQFYQNNVPKDIHEEQKLITWAENLVFIFPTWWNGMPAILKGYLDRVFTNGFAFQFSKGKVEGLLAGKKVVIFQTTSQTEDFMKPNQLVSSMETIIDLGFLNYCGFNVLTHKFFYSVPQVDQETREKMLGEVRGVVDIM
ncbi:NAD(P)H-dependent oxidoreductase [Metabacillus sp. HB246100]